jgi:hypothetical protein
MILFWFSPPQRGSPGGPSRVSTVQENRKIHLSSVQSHHDMDTDSLIRHWLSVYQKTYIKDEQKGDGEIKIEIRKKEVEK